MNLEEVDYFLHHLQPLQQKGCIEEGLRNITAVFDLDRLTRGETGAVLSNILNYTSVIQDCSIDVNADGFSEHLFRITSTGVSLQGDAIKFLDEETDVNASRYRRDINSHANSGREGNVVYELVNLLQEISNTSYTLDSTILISKFEILDIWISSTSSWSVDPERLYIQFWFEIENFVDWVDSRDLVEYASEMFSAEEMPILVYYSNSTEMDLNGSEYFPVFELSDSPQYLSSQYDSYRNKMSSTRENTSYFHQAPAITPSLFAESPSLRTVFKPAFVYSIFAIFSDRVAVSNSFFLFSAEYGPNTIGRDEVNIEKFSSNLSEEHLADLADLYQDFARREDRAKFVEFWRRSMLRNCDGITDIIDEIADIRKSYQFIESEVIEKNFDELSDAVRDTNTFMTEITSQVSDTTTALSDEIQRLVFALLGAIIANLFLILRWSNFDTVIPFSLFVVSAILLFYFPLIDRRIEELEEMKSKGQEDYETYKDLISDFTGQAFDFDDLEARKDEYLSYADQRLQWSRRKIRQIHAVLLLTGLLFVFFANLQYEVFTIQVAFSGVFFVSSSYITYQTHTQTDEYSYHRLDLNPFGQSSSDSSDSDGGDVDEVGEDDENDDEADPTSTNYLPLIVSALSLAAIIVHIAVAY
ncbi:hypothetical protein [Haloarcula laminariae]|uniref:hypothetical protein n=1 Tax=Haloarcula laminariae TaxID=2961577 RepID=UPI0021CAB6C1|nr:hypothetical protein [Halomicroarcula laminariae]